MNKSFIWAAIVAVLMLTASHFYGDYVNVYLSVSVSVCSFLFALSVSVVSAIKKLSKHNTDDMIVLQGVLQKSAESVVSQLKAVLNEIETVKSENNNNYVQLHSDLEKVDNDIMVVSDYTVSLIDCHKSFFNDLINVLNDKANTLNKSLSANLNAMSNLDVMLNSTANSVSKSVSALQTTTNQAAADLCRAEKEFVNKLSDVNKCLGNFAVSIVSIDKSNMTLSAKVVDAAKLIETSLSDVPRQNKKTIEDFGDKVAGDFENHFGKMNKIIFDMTESLSQNEKNIRDSIDELRKQLSSDLAKIEIDVDGLCSSIEDMKLMSQTIEQSDMELLERIDEFCKF